jgi:1,4-alpha-glucan branching enzyme
MNIFGGRPHFRRYGAILPRMLKRRRNASGKVKVTFALPDSGECVSVVGDFNGWDPWVSPLRRRSNGTRSVTVALDRGRPYTFRYLSGGQFFDEAEADEWPPNGYGGTHSVIVP